MADFESLVAEIGGLRAVIRNNQAKIEAKIKTIQDGRDAMKAQVGSSAYQIDANHKEMKEEMKSGQAEMKATVSAILQKMKSWREGTKACLEKMDANPEELKPLKNRP
jgi:hypothetical protein